MFGRRGKSKSEAPAEPVAASPLKEALRQARIDAAERTGVVLDLRDAEAARLDLLNEALDPVFAEIPASVDIFDRGVSRGESPRLWIDIVAHVTMGRDKRLYRFLQDTRYGRKVLFESDDIAEMTRAITRYIAGRMIERERALANGLALQPRDDRRARWPAIVTFVFGVVVGVAALVIVALMQSSR